jgi:mycoredoxin
MTTFGTLSPYARLSAPPVTPVVVYGRRWCALSQMVRRWFDCTGIPYQYVDLDLHPDAEARLAWLAGGQVRSPIVSLGGELLVQPSIAELQWILSRS